jgi:hypothetical protein
LLRGEQAPLVQPERPADVRLEAAPGRSPSGPEIRLEKLQKRPVDDAASLRAKWRQSASHDPGDQGDLNNLFHALPAVLTSEYKVTLIQRNVFAPPLL